MEILAVFCPQLVPFASLPAVPVVGLADAAQDGTGRNGTGGHGTGQQDGVYLLTLGKAPRSNGARWG